MTGANRYYRPVGTVQLGRVAQLPFDQMMKGLGTHQTRYDQIASAAQQLADKELNYLNPDAEKAAEIMERQKQLEQDILNMGDLSRQSRAATDKLRGFAKDVYGKQGVGTAIESSYADYQETLKRIQESDLPQKEKDLAIAMWMSKYEGVGEGEDIGYGKRKYNTFGVKNAPEYVDMAEYAKKYMEEMDPRVLAQEGISKSPDGNWFIKKGQETKILTIDEMVKAVAPIAKNDPKFQDYLNFRGQLYGYQLENSPGALESINEKRKVSFEKQKEVFNKKKAIANTYKEATTTLERQKAINKIIDELGVDMPKLKEDGKEGPATKKAMEEMEVAIKTLEQMEPGEFQELSMEEVIQEWQNETMMGTFRGVADIYDKYDSKNTIDMIADQFKLARKKFEYNKRLKDMDNVAVIPRSMNVGGVVSEKYKELDVRYNKDGKLVMGSKHPALDSYNKTIKGIDAQIAAIKAGGSASDRQPGNYTAGSTDRKVLSAEEQKQVNKLEKLKKIAIKERKEKQQEILKGYRQDFNKYLRSINPDLVEVGKDGKLRTKKNATGLGDLWKQYEEANKELYTTSGTVMKVPTKLEEKIEKEILGDGLTGSQIYYVNDDGAVVRMSTDEIQKYGKVQSVNLEGEINSSTSPLKWASGYVATIKNSEGETKQIYIKQSSNEEDMLGKAGMDISNAMYNISDSGETTQYNIFGERLFNVKYQKTWINGKPGVGVIVPPGAINLIENSEDRKIALQLSLGRNKQGGLLFDPVSYTKFANIVGGKKQLIQ